MKLILGSKVQSLFCFETSTTEGRGGEKRASANSRTKHTEPLTKGLCSPLYNVLTMPLSKTKQIARGAAATQARLWQCKVSAGISNQTLTPLHQRCITAESSLRMSMGLSTVGEATKYCLAGTWVPIGERKVTGWIFIFAVQEFGHLKKRV